MKTTYVGITECIEDGVQGMVTATTAPTLYVNGVSTPGVTVTVDSSTAYKLVVTHSTSGRAVGDILRYIGGTATVGGVVYPIVIEPRYVDNPVASRMATYTQPTGFLATTFPASVGSYNGPTVSPLVPASVLGSPGLYCSADSGVVLTSNRVSQWTDYSGNAKHLTQTNPSARPAPLPDADLPGIVFEQDAEQWLLKPGGYSVDTSAYTILMIVDVCNPTGNGSEGGQFCVLDIQGSETIGLDFGGANVATGTSPVTHGQPYFYHASNASFNFFGDPTATTADKKPIYLPTGRQVVAVRYDEANDRVEFFRGIERRSVTIPGGFGSTQNGGRIGSLNDFGAHFVGRHHARVEWPRVLSDNELFNYMALLGARWQAPIRRRRNLIVVGGDSLTTATGVGGCTSTAREIDAERFDADVFVGGRSSETTDQSRALINMPGRANSLADQPYDSKSYDQWSGTNDVALDGATSSVALSRHDALFTALDSRYTNRFATTMLPRDGVTESVRTTYNNGLATRFGVKLIDLRPTAVNPPAAITNTDLYYDDQIHLALTGRTYAANATNATLNRNLRDPATSFALTTVATDAATSKTAALAAQAVGTQSLVAIGGTSGPTLKAQLGGFTAMGTDTVKGQIAGQGGGGNSYTFDDEQVTLG